MLNLKHVDNNVYMGQVRKANEEHTQRQQALRQREEQEKAAKEEQKRNRARDRKRKQRELEKEREIQSGERSPGGHKRPKVSDFPLSQGLLFTFPPIYLARTTPCHGHSYRRVCFH